MVHGVNDANWWDVPAVSAFRSVVREFLMLIDARKQYVQHAGAFIVLVLLQAFGLYQHVETLRKNAISRPANSMSAAARTIRRMWDTSTGPTRVRWPAQNCLRSPC